MSDNINIKDNFALLMYSFILMIVGVMLIYIDDSRNVFWTILIATLFIYIPVLLRLYQHAGGYSYIGRVLTILLNTFIIFGELLSILGISALMFGIVIGIAVGGFGILGFAAVPLLLSSVMYLKVGFGIKKGNEVLVSLALISCSIVALLILSASRSYV